MRRKKVAEEKAEEPVEKTQQTSEESEPQTELELLEEVLKKAKKKILSDRNDFSVSDLIRILQARHELKAELVREIEVRWVDEDTDGGGASKK